VFQDKLKIALPKSLERRARQRKARRADSGEAYDLGPPIRIAGDDELLEERPLFGGSFRDHYRSLVEGLDGETLSVDDVDLD